MKEKDFYAGFETVQDHLTAHIQLNKINEKVFEGLKEDYGKVIPLQTRKQLIDRFDYAMRELDY